MQQKHYLLLKQLTMIKRSELILLKELFITRYDRLRKMLVLMALWFYPMSMGSSYTDPYALGFGNFQFSTALLLLGLLAWVLRAYATCLILVSAQLGFGALLHIMDGRAHNFGSGFVQ